MFWQWNLAIWAHNLPTGRREVMWNTLFLVKFGLLFKIKRTSLEAKQVMAQKSIKCNLVKN